MELASALHLQFTDPQWLNGYYYVFFSSIFWITLLSLRASQTTAIIYGCACWPLSKKLIIGSLYYYDNVQSLHFWSFIALKNCSKRLIIWFFRRLLLLRINPVCLNSREATATLSFCLHSWTWGKDLYLLFAIKVSRCSCATAVDYTWLLYFCASSGENHTTLDGCNCQL